MFHAQIGKHMNSVYGWILRMVQLDPIQPSAQRHIPRPIQVPPFWHLGKQSLVEMFDAGMAKHMNSVDGWTLTKETEESLPTISTLAFLWANASSTVVAW
jgi:hypothetical protein